ncbi:MAG: hypothetical protein ACK5KT_16335 [Dysgonomonas sp.]
MKKNGNKGVIIGVVVGIAIVASLLFLFRGNVYQMMVKYEDAGNRKSYTVKDEAFATFINRNLPNDESLDENIDIEQIIDFSLDMTVKTLDYLGEASETDPQKTLMEGYANYVGYAAFTATVGDYLIKRFGLNKEWEVKPKKAKLYMFGTNKTKKALDGWYKDHDFVVFKNRATKEEIYVDPAAYESYGTKRVDKYQK